MAKRILVIVGALALIGAMSSAPVQAQDNDHYACYQLKHKIKPKPKPSGNLTNNLVEVAGNFSKCKLKFLCVPTEKNGGGVIGDPNLHYCAWQCKGGKPLADFAITDQFGFGSVSTKKLKFILNKCDVTNV